ncbi:MAG: cytochrome c oxidase subunit II, partial [Thermomicrobiales bacterium]
MGTVTVFGIVIPGIILIGVFGMTLWALTDLSKPASASEETIAIVGHQWWWEVNYNDRDFTTANEIHIPVGKPVQLTLTSNDVIHSFWVPQLSDKIDMIPGHTNTLWIQADRAGEYRGQCAEFCGAQHAQMAFVVIADSPDAYDGWIAQQQQAAPDPSNPQLEKGQQAFFSAACMYCHRIEGTSASGTVGPDLTHLGSRNYIGAGTLKNTPGNLAGWITNSQSIKPNNQMPNFFLAPDQLQAIIAYLESLK